MDLNTTFKMGFRDNTITNVPNYKVEVDTAYNRQLFLYNQFVEIKDCYMYMYEYEMEDTNFKKITQLIFTYGLYDFPEEVHNFLNFQYNDISKKKISDDIRHQINESKLNRSKQ